MLHIVSVSLKLTISNMKHELKHYFEDILYFFIFFQSELNKDNHINQL